MARTGIVLLACRAAKVGRRRAYRRRRIDPVFARQWQEALEEAADVLEAEARRRGLNGVDEPVFHRGEQIATVKKHSDVLLMFLLKGTRPAKYRDNVPQAGPPVPDRPRLDIPGSDPRDRSPEDEAGGRPPEAGD